jgi:hypothetical protein
MATNSKREEERERASLYCCFPRSPGSPGEVAPARAPVKKAWCILRALARSDEDRFFHAGSSAAADAAKSFFVLRRRGGGSAALSDCSATLSNGEQSGRLHDPLDFEVNSLRSLK